MVAIQLAVYASPSSVFVAIPTSFWPSREAEQLYGPLHYHRNVTATLADDPDVASPWSCAMAEIDAHSYAVLSRAEAHALGLDCADPTLQPISPNARGLTPCTS